MKKVKKEIPKVLSKLTIYREKSMVMTPYIVIDVSDDGKEIIIQECEPIFDGPHEFDARPNGFKIKTPVKGDHVIKKLHFSENIGWYVYPKEKHTERVILGEWIYQVYNN